MTVVPRPVGPRVLVKPLEDDEMTASGVVLPDEVRKNRGVRGMVVAAGEYVWISRTGDEPLRYPLREVKVGDIIVWDKRDGITVTVNNELLVSLFENEVVAVLDEASVATCASER